MRRQRLPLPAVLVALALAGTLASSGGATAGGAALRVRSFDPVSVQGSRFEQSEPVIVVLDGVWSKHVRATSVGSFVVTFWAHSASRCDGYVVKAIGSRGSRARLDARPLACASINPG